MKNSAAMKFLLILTSAVLIIAVLACAAGILLLGEYGMYEDTPEQWKAQQLESVAYTYAFNAVSRYAAENLGNCSMALIAQQFPFPRSDTFEIYGVTLKQDDKILEDTYTYQEGAISFTHNITPLYPVLADSDLAKELGEPQYTKKDTVDVGGEEVSYQLAFYEAENYSITVFVNLGTNNGPVWDTIYSIYAWRYWMIAILALGLVAFAAVLVGICYTAGHRPGTAEIRPGGFNRLPLDLYGVAVAGILLLVADPLWRLLRWAVEDGVNWGGVSFAAICIMLLTVLGVAYLMAWAAQLKYRRDFWWRNSAVARILMAILGVCRRCVMHVRRFFEMLPVIWQWLVAGGIMLGMLLLGVFWAVRSSGLLFVLALLACGGILCYGAYCFGILIRGAQRLARGNLEDKVPTAGLIGCFKDFAEELNTLADVTAEAVRKQLKSERMKTELITNVSHDIKTPLTSIINYADLLQKAQTPEQREEYLSVLQRQSQRMKKLIEDLVEMSKATSGNVAVNITQVDASEAVHQALGEFSDKLDAAELTPVCRMPQQPALMQADGRLVWRVLSNILSNAVKYALPGTRLYVDVLRLDGKVLISMKNVSRTELNVSAEELMERFVRGDKSRNTEGSGLGLNIARGLMEVQGGQLRLLVDGDLFKVTLEFPGA